MQEKIISSYKVLGLEGDATLEQVKKAYKKLSNIFHPDKHIANKSIVEIEIYNNKFIEIKEAYNNILSFNIEYNKNCKSDTKSYEDIETEYNFNYSRFYKILITIIVTIVVIGFTDHINYSIYQIILVPFSLLCFFYIIYSWITTIFD